MEEVSDRCCRPRRPTSRREGGRESPPTREGSGILGATDPDDAGGAKQPNTMAPGEDVDSPHRGASTAETMLARPMPSRQREKKKEDEERCGGCATRIDLERRRMRNGDDKPADTGRRRGRIGR